MKEYPNGAYIFTEHKGDTKKKVVVMDDPMFPHKQMVCLENGDCEFLTLILNQGTLADNHNTGELEEDQEVWDHYRKAEEIPSDWKPNGCNVVKDGNCKLGCYIHDWEYDKGGTAFHKRVADLRLMKYFQKKGRPKMANLVYVGLKLGGWMNFNYREESLLLKVGKFLTIPFKLINK